MSFPLPFPPAAGILLMIGLLLSGGHPATARGSRKCSAAIMFILPHILTDTATFRSALPPSRAPSRRPVRCTLVHQIWLNLYSHFRRSFLSCPKTGGHTLRRQIVNVFSWRTYFPGWSPWEDKQSRQLECGDFYWDCDCTGQSAPGIWLRFSTDCFPHFPVRFLLRIWSTL